MKTRPYRELFQLMIDNRKLFPGGLCDFIDEMCDNNIINKAEYFKLENYIDSHRPKRGKHYDPYHNNSGWYWDRDEWPPRLAWLKDQVKKYS